MTQMSPLPPDADRLDALLPQTQCTRCGYPACHPYARAIAAGEADINRCAPGGGPVIAALAAATGRPARPLADDVVAQPRLRLARIDEDNCIGCTKCIQVCPVDAIIGARKLMHTVLADDCTGCELCLPPCPVDCIDLHPDPTPWDDRRAAQARRRYLRRQQRLSISRRSEPRTAPPDVAPVATSVNTNTNTDTNAPPPPADRKAVVAAAVARARARRAARTARADV